MQEEEEGIHLISESEAKKRNKETR